MRLILASASPRRAALLTSAGFTFSVMPPDVDETAYPGEKPGPYALRLARDKAAVAAASDGRVVLGADTTVVMAPQILGKPRTRDEAAGMLRTLSGGVHEVLTAIVMLAGDLEMSEVVTTRVHFIAMDDAEIEWYLGTGEWEGKAGAYAIQGAAARYIERIEGSWSNVVGLPVSAVYRLLKQLAPAIDPLSAPRYSEGAFRKSL